jgi:hypothetical protein
MKKQEQVIGGLLIAIAAALVLGAIANNPRVSPLWRRIAVTAEGEIFQHVITGDIVKLLA